MVVKMMKSRKALGVDVIILEIIKVGGQVMIEMLNKIFSFNWKVNKYQEIGQKRLQIASTNKETYLIQINTVQ